MKKDTYSTMNARLKGMIAEVCEIDGISCADLSQRLGYGPEYIQKKTAAKALPELRLKDVMLLAGKCGRRIKFEDVESV